MCWSVRPPPVKLPEARRKHLIAGLSKKKKNSIHDVEHKWSLLLEDHIFISWIIHVLTVCIKNIAKAKGKQLAPTKGRGHQYFISPGGYRGIITECDRRERTKLQEGRQNMVSEWEKKNVCFGMSAGYNPASRGMHKYKHVGSSDWNINCI